MAKEMMIVFIYDTIKNDEFHDPVKSVVYFHPSWVSEAQKVLLCGQLMGTAHFLRETLFKPKIISLQSGKFAIKSFGRFLMTFSTILNCNDIKPSPHKLNCIVYRRISHQRLSQAIHCRLYSSVHLVKRVSCIPWLLQGRGQDILCHWEAVGSDRNISDIVLEHRAHFLYILIQMYHCDIDSIYQQVSSPDRETKFVDKLYSIMESYLPLLQFNGNIFQNVSSLKIPKSASNLYLESNQILQSFQQTKGVLGGTILYHNKVVASQLSDNLTKIITLSDLFRLKSSDYVTANYHVPVGVTLINAYLSNNEYTELVRSSTQSHNLFNNSNAKDFIPFQIRRKSSTKDTHTLMKRDKSIIFTHIPEEDLDDEKKDMPISHRKKSSFNRPTHLPLFYKNQLSLDKTESGFNSINFDETDSFPNFIGKTSVCSTPMTENKVLPHGNMLSICATSDDVDEHKQLKNQQERNCKESFATCQNNTVENQILTNNKIDKQTTINNHFNYQQKNKFVTYSLPNICDIEVSDEIVNVKKHRIRNLSKSIADPSFPIFNSNNGSISYSMLTEFLKQHYDDMKKITGNKNGTQYVVQNTTEVNEKTTIENVFCTKSLKSRQELNLPLKALDLKNTDSSQACKMLDSPFRCKKLAGIQLTPLMSKLTILAMSDQQSSGFASWDATPGFSFKNPMTPMEFQPKSRTSKTFFSDDSTNAVEDLVATESDKPIKVELFICVQQNMTLVLVLQEHSSEKEDMIHSLFETCVSKLSKVEQSLHQVMSINVEGFDKGDGSYSFICLDSKWDVNNRCGPWTPRDLLTLNSIHNNFHYNRKLIELLLKSQDSVIYAYRCGRSEIYYQQSSIVLPGLPPPQDAMGTLPLCAKRRLERDHKILLL